MNHRYEPQSKLWTTIPQQAAGYYTFRLRSRTPAGLQKASLTNKTGKMTSIIRAKLKDLQSLSEIGKISFIESHGSSAPVADINIYLKKKFNDKGISEELSDPENIYHIIYHNERPAGYSKIIFNTTHSNIPMRNVAKLERLYLLKEFYSLQLGLELLKFNIELGKRNNQAGMWLYVWKENYRAIGFYEKNGFVVIGSYDFKLTETHSTPNHQMFLRYLYPSADHL